MFGFGNMFQGPEGHGRGFFETTYRAYSVSMLPGQERADVEKGGKIIMPPSALDTLTRLHIQYPMLFKLTNKKGGRDSHCGVLEFVADEGKIYLPYWMMNNLVLQEGDLITLKNVSLPVATFAKFKPQSVDFLDISNPKAVLENALRNFACLTKGDTLAIKYNEKDYELCVEEVKPGPAVSIIECDMNVEFSAPVGYKEPEPVHRATSEEEQQEQMAVDVAEFIEKSSFRAFSGAGNRLDGKSKNTESAAQSVQPHELKRGIPNYNYKKGKITFIRAARVQNGVSNTEEDNSNFEAFSGQGQSLRKKSARKV